MKTIIKVFKFSLVTIIVSTILFMYYGYSQKIELDKGCLINAIEEMDDYARLWNNKNDYICGVKVSEWSDAHFNKMNEILSNEINTIKMSKNSGRVVNDSEQGARDNIKISRLSDAILNIPKIKKNVDNNTNWSARILAVIALFILYARISGEYNNTSETSGDFIRNRRKKSNSNSYNESSHPPQKKNDTHSAVYRADRKVCATCVYWCGNREINSNCSQLRVEIKNALCQVSKMTKDPITNRNRGASTKYTAPNFGLNCKYHKKLIK